MLVGSLFSQAATLAYQKLEQTLQNPQLINDLQLTLHKKRCVLVERINKQTQLLRETTNGLEQVHHQKLLIELEIILD